MKAWHDHFRLNFQNIERTVGRPHEYVWRSLKNKNWLALVQGETFYPLCQATSLEGLRTMAKYQCRYPKNMLTCGHSSLKELPMVNRVPCLSGQPFTYLGK